MTFAILFVFLSLGPLVALCGEEYWIPSMIPHPAQQCHNLSPSFAGVCKITDNLRVLLGRRYTFWTKCEILICAHWRPGNRYRLKWGRQPFDGTICGISHVCKNQRCRKIHPSKMPTETGIMSAFECTL